MTITIECHVCKDDFDIKPYREDSAKYCSKECMAEGYKDKVEVECDWCGETFERMKSSVGEYENHFCNKRCKGKWMSENIVGEDHHKYSKVEVECDKCGKVVTKKKCNANNGRNFCSGDCWYEFSKKDRVQVSCYWCGNVFNREVWWANDGKNFCSDGCINNWQSEIFSGSRHPNWNGGSKLYGESWQRQRLKALECAGHQCEHCGLTQERCRETYYSGLHVHHMTPYRLFESDDRAHILDNLKVLCPPCHKNAEYGTSLCGGHLPHPDFDTENIAV